MQPIFILILLWAAVFGDARASNRLDLLCPYRKTLIVDHHPNLSARELVTSSTTLPLTTYDGWRDHVANVYHSLQAKYRTTEGKAEMDAMFLTLIEKWKANPGYPPGLHDGQWDLKDVKSVEDYLKLVPYDNHYSSQPTGNMLNAVLGAAEIIADGNRNPKWRTRLDEGLPELLVYRVVMQSRYHHPPDNARFP